MTFKELIDEKTGILEGAEGLLYDGIESSEKAIFSSVLKILRSLAQKEGRLQKETINKKFLSGLTARVLKAIRESTLQRKIESFLPNFEKIEELNNLIYKDLADKTFTKKVRDEIGVFRKITIDKVVNDLLGENQLKSNYIDPIRNILFNGVATRQSVKDVEDNLRNYIKGNGQRRGTFSRYVRQITIDALNQHDGAINDIARDAFQLDGWRYVGSVIDTTRDNCRHLVNSTGKLKQFQVRKGLYRVADLEEIIKVLQKGSGSGWNPLTTPETWAQYRGGFGCRHAVIYLPLPD